MKKLLVICILLVVSHGMANGQDDTTRTGLRWHARMQVAGFQGLVSLGGGPVLAKGVWRPGLMYGFAPATGGRDAVHQIILRNDIVFMPAKRGNDLWFSPAISANLMLETGRHSYLSLPDQFPRDYYGAPQPRATFGFGVRSNRSFAEKSLFREFTLSAEFVALDNYLWFAISQRGVPVHKAFGLSFALSMAM